MDLLADRGHLVLQSRVDHPVLVDEPATRELRGGHDDGEMIAAARQVGHGHLGAGERLLDEGLDLGQIRHLLDRFRDQPVELARRLQLADDVTAADELAADEHLGERRPLGVSR